MKSILFIIFAIFTFSTSVYANSALTTEKVSLDEFEDEFKEFELLDSGFYLGFNFGQRTFNGDLGRLTDGALALGLNFLYQFNPAFAAEVSFNRSSHDYGIAGRISGNIDMNVLTLKGRYYPSFAKINKNLSPYISLGISRNSMVTQVRDQTITATSDFNGYETGLGFRYAFVENSVFFDFQANYKSLDLPNRGVVLDGNLAPTGFFFAGDEVNLMSSVSFIL